MVDLRSDNYEQRIAELEAQLDRECMDGYADGQFYFGSERGSERFDRIQRERFDELKRQHVGIRGSQ